MSWIVGALAITSSFDLAQRCRQLREARPGERVIVAAGAFAIAVVLAAIATPLLDALDISGPNMEIGSGVVLAVYSLVALVTWDEGVVPASLYGGVVPLLFPILLTPVVGVVLLAVSARNGMLVPVLTSAVAMAVIASPLAGQLAGRRPVRTLSATIGVVTGVAMIVDGAFAV